MLPRPATRLTYLFINDKITFPGLAAQDTIHCVTNIDPSTRYCRKDVYGVTHIFNCIDTRSKKNKK